MSNESYSQTAPFVPDGNRHLINENDPNELLDDGVSPITFNQYLALQTEIILGDKNRQQARAALGHEASDNELGEYYVESGQAEEFRAKHYQRVIQKKAA